jgi:hypothetical protein
MGGRNHTAFRAADSNSNADLPDVLRGKKLPLLPTPQEDPYAQKLSKGRLSAKPIERSWSW